MPRLTVLICRRCMMQNVHLAPDTDEDDLYSGYNDHNPTYDTEVKKPWFPTWALANRLAHKNFGFEYSAFTML